MKDTLKYLLILLFWCIVGFIIFSAACKKETPVPQLSPEEKADNMARLLSMKGEIVKVPPQGNSSVEGIDMHYEVMASSTGKLFYRGELCPENCEYYILGYTWAKELGVTRVDACQKVTLNPRLKSPAYSKGCAQAAFDNILQH